MMRHLRAAVVRLDDTQLHCTVTDPWRAPRTHVVPWSVGAEDAAVAAARAWGGPVGHVTLAVGGALLRRAQVALPPVSPADQRAMLALDPARWFVASPGVTLAIAAPDAAGMAYAADAATVDAWVTRLDAWAPVDAVAACPTSVVIADDRASLESAALRTRFQRRAQRRLAGWGVAACLSVALLGWSVDDARARRLAWLTAERATLVQREGDLLADAAQVQQFSRDVAIAVAYHDSSLHAAPWLATVSQRLPSDAVLQRVSYDAGILRLDGSALSARRVLEALAAAPGVKDARLTAPATRAGGPGNSRETFSIAISVR
jgi:hypothetical protein